MMKMMVMMMMVMMIMMMVMIMIMMMKTVDIPAPTWVFVGSLPRIGPAGFTRQMRLISLKAGHRDVNDENKE